MIPHQRKPAKADQKSPVKRRMREGIGQRDQAPPPAAATRKQDEADAHGGKQPTKGSQRPPQRIRTKGLLRAGFDAQQHAALHHEVHPIIGEGADRLRDWGGWWGECAGDEKRGVRIHRQNHDGTPEIGDFACFVDTQRPESAVPIDRAARAEDFVTLLVLLPLRANFVCVMNIGQHQVFQPVVAVEPSAFLPQLHDPLPDFVGRGIDGDAARGGGDDAIDCAVARQGARGLVSRHAPAIHPGIEDIQVEHPEDDNHRQDKPPAVELSDRWFHALHHRLKIR